MCAEQPSPLKQFINRAETSTRWALPPWTEAGLWAPAEALGTRAQGAAPLPTPGPTWPGGSREARPTRALAHSSFLLLWSAVLIMYPTSLAVISMTFSNYVLQPVFPNCIPPAAASRALSMACLSECPSWGWAGPLSPGPTLQGGTWGFVFCVVVKKIFFVPMWTISKVFIKFVAIVFLFYALALGPGGLWDHSSPPRDRTHTPYIGRQSLNHWTTGEVPCGRTLGGSILPAARPP